MKRRIMSLALAAVLLAGGLFAGGGTASAEEETFTGEEKVVVSVEGLTLGQGFYVEPTVYTFDELVAAAAEKGETKTAAEITAQDAIIHAIEDGGYTPNMAESFYGGYYLSGIKGADKGYVALPDILKDKVTLGENTDTELGEFDYTTTAGWMFSEHNTAAPVGMGDYVLSSYGESCTVDGEEYYVIRLMFSIYNSGSDLGFVGWDSTDTTESEWGSSCAPLYTAADRSETYAKYASLKASGFFAENAEAKAAALKSMEILDASEQQMKDVYQAMAAAEKAALEKPVETTKPEEAAAVNTAASEKSLETTTAPATKKAENAKTGDSQAPLLWTVVMMGTAAAGVVAARRKRMCENGSNS